MSSLPAGRLQSILVPLDGSSLAEQAIPLAQAIAERSRAKLKLVLVHDRVLLMQPGPDYTSTLLASGGSSSGISSAALQPNAEANFATRSIPGAAPPLSNRPT